MRIWSTDSLRELAGYDLLWNHDLSRAIPMASTWQVLCLRIWLSGRRGTERDVGAICPVGSLEFGNGARRAVFWADDELGHAVELFATRTLLAAATVSDGALIWQRNTAEPIRLVAPNETQVDQVAFSHDDRFLLAAYRNGQVLVWDISEQRVIGKMVLPWRPTVKFADDRRRDTRADIVLERFDHSRLGLAERTKGGSAR